MPTQSLVPPSSGIVSAHPAPHTSPVVAALRHGYASTISASEWLTFLRETDGTVALAFEGSISTSYVVLEDDSPVVYQEWATGSLSGPRDTCVSKIATSLEDVTPSVVAVDTVPYVGADDEQ